MARARTDLAFSPRTHHVTGTRLGCAKERAAPLNLLRLIRFGRIERRVGTPRILNGPPRGRELLIIIRPVPIAGPLPDVAGHIEKAVAVGRILRYRRHTGITVFGGVVVWEVTFVRIRHPLP